MELETTPVTNVTNCQVKQEQEQEKHQEEGEGKGKQSNVEDNSVFQEVWDGTSRLVYGSFTNVTQVICVWN